MSLLLAVAMVTMAAGVYADRAAAASPQDEKLFVEMINDLRASKGLPALVVHAELTTGARAWTERMATSDQLAHSPDMSSGISAKWSVLGENVGMHGVHDLGQLFQAFVNSPAHYQNLVDSRFNYIGVGVVSTSEGKLWTTHRLMATPAATPSPPTTKAPTLTTVAPTTTTATTPTTTTPKTVPATNQPPATTPATVPTPSTAPTSGPATTAAPFPEPLSTIVPEPPDSQPEDGLDFTIVDDPTAGPSMPDVPTVEQVLVELAEAGI